MDHPVASGSIQVALVYTVENYGFIYFNPSLLLVQPWLSFHMVLGIVMKNRCLVCPKATVLQVIEVFNSSLSFFELSSAPGLLVKSVFVCIACCPVGVYMFPDSVNNGTDPCRTVVVVIRDDVAPIQRPKLRLLPLVGETTVEQLLPSNISLTLDQWLESFRKFMGSKRDIDKPTVQGLVDNIY